MKITLRVILCVLLIAFFKCTNKSSVNTDDKRQLLDLERAWLEHEFALDTAFLASIMDSTFIGISENGVKDRQGALLGMYNNIDQTIKNGIVVDSFRLEDEVVTVYENSAVVTFIVHTYRHDKDSLIARRTRFYDVWTRRGDKWKAVASQGTTIQE
jgi:hypothetical protein